MDHYCDVLELERKSLSDFEWDSTRKFIGGLSNLNNDKTKVMLMQANLSVLLSLTDVSFIEISLFEYVLNYL